ncbi:hypothetical protein CMI38_07230 [Candidatus Pacearchaeota archaeon]|jgi:prolyl-tRNA editing enzyme YbaK/EbsC (Cys-tRNA(Pro) deacylase)|nr:hypothetical protein [Candidatus Pacearchaeota archaeon]|tara:strand:+ start:99 stop:569 length:471 start_codon:yes stop_codon:yes gene_type:complete
MGSKDCEKKLKNFLIDNNSEGEHLSFDESCHSVEEAAEVVGCSEKDFVKNICMIDNNGRLIVAIVKGEDRASTKAVSRALSIERLRLASPDEILEMTGYLFGGTPSFGFDAIFLIDNKVMKEEMVYSGGGSDKSLVKISPEEILKLNNGNVVRVRK